MKAPENRSFYVKMGCLPLEKVGTLLGKLYKSVVLLGTYIEHVGKLGNVLGNILRTWWEHNKKTLFPPPKNIFHMEEGHYYPLYIPKVKQNISYLQRKGSSQTRNPNFRSRNDPYMGLGFRVWSPYPT